MKRLWITVSLLLIAAGCYAGWIKPAPRTNTLQLTEVDPWWQIDKPHYLNRCNPAITNGSLRLLYSPFPGYTNELYLTAGEIACRHIEPGSTPPLQTTISFLGKDLPSWTLSGTTAVACIAGTLTTNIAVGGATLYFGSGLLTNITVP